MSTVSSPSGIANGTSKVQRALGGVQCCRQRARLLTYVLYIVLSAKWTWYASHSNGLITAACEPVPPTSPLRHTLHPTLWVPSVYSRINRQAPAFHTLGVSTLGCDFSIPQSVQSVRHPLWGPTAPLSTVRYSPCQKQLLSAAQLPYTC